MTLEPATGWRTPPPSFASSAWFPILLAAHREAARRTGLRQGYLFGYLQGLKGRAP